MIVEDEDLVRRSLEVFIKKLGHDVTSTESGKKAIDLILQNNFDRVICDLMLVDITGFEIIESVKIKYSNEEIQDLFKIITAYISDQVIQRAKKYNCAIFRKPFKNIKITLDEILQ